MGADARVRVGLDGVGEAVSGARKVKDAVRDIGGAAKGSTLSQDFGQVKGALDGMGMSFKSIVSEADRASRSILGVTDVDITGAKRRYKELDDSIARLAITGGRTTAELKQQIRDLAQTRHVAEKEIVQSVQTINQETRNAPLAADVQPVLIEQQKRTGRPREAIDRFAVAAMNNLNVRSPDAMRSLFAKTEDVASATHYPGGAGGLQDVLGSLDLRGARIRNEADRNRLVGLVGMAGQGLGFQQARERAQAIVGGISGLDVNMLVRTLGKDSAGLFDSSMRRDVPTIYEALQSRYRAKFKTPHQRTGAMLAELGDNAQGLGGAMFSIDGKTIQGVADGNTVMVDRPFSLDDKEAVYDAHSRAVQQINKPRGQRYDQTSAGKRAGQAADDENFETEQVGERSQKAEDAYKQGLSPAARMLFEKTALRKTGVATGAAVLSGLKGDVEERAGTKAVTENRYLDPAALREAVKNGAREGIKAGLAEDRGKQPDLGPGSHVRQESRRGRGN